MKAKKTLWRIRDIIETEVLVEAIDFSEAIGSVRLPSGIDDRHNVNYLWEAFSYICDDYGAWLK